ncbi:MAG TPA: amidohydrolase family protein [Thermoanaerobaculia bacterium]|nr:amidohydrolase family protein [Thermoanaerobaculia bacterium]
MRVPQSYFADFDWATITPARIFGAGRQLGTLEKGKIANVVITDKPIFTKDAKVKRVFVDGRETKLPTEAERTRRAANEAAASARRHVEPDGENAAGRSEHHRNGASRNGAPALAGGTTG